MNCVLSGDTGLAFVLDGGRALLIRADRPEEIAEVRVEEFHRVFASVTDRVFLEGTRLDEIRDRLSLACRASTALSLALLVLDVKASEELRADAAADLQGLIDDPRTLNELEAVLLAAPLPESADVAGAERACEQSSADAVRNLLVRLVARQHSIRAVCTAWSDLPLALFDNEDRRRAARAVCVREGMFLALVCQAEAGRDASEFLADALRKPTMLRSFARFREVLQRWSGVLPKSVGAVDSASVLFAEEDGEHAPSRKRGRKATSASGVSKSPGTKLLVDEAIRRFTGELPAASSGGPAVVARLVTETRARLETIHGWRAEDRPHFTKSISNVAARLLEFQQNAAAADLLSWSLRKGLTDAFTYASLVDAWGKAGEPARAQEVFDAALAAGSADAFTYSALVDAWGKAGEPARAQEVFDAALTADLANGFTYNSLVDAWGKAGEPARAQEVFDAALAAGLASEFTYSALVDAWGKAGEPARAQEAFDAALATGLANEFTYSAFVDAWGKGGEPARAQEVFDAALAAGLANEFTYSSLVDAWGKGGEPARAQEVFDAALAAGLANEFIYSSLVDAWGKAGEPARAQDVFEAAVATGLADEFTYNSLVDAWGKAGEPAHAQRVFDQALAAGLADDVSDLVLLRAMLSNAVSEDVLTRAVESLLSRRQLDRVSPSVAATVAWAAARLARLDWIRSLPAGARNPRTLFAFALRVQPSDDAVSFLQGLGDAARASVIALRYRLIGPVDPGRELRSLARDCRGILHQVNELDTFSRIRITETEVRCLRRYATIDEAIATWAPINELPIGNRETRASLLAESGRDLLVGGLRHREEGQCVRGAERLKQGWGLARLSDLNDLETLWAASEALGGYADARVAMATAPPALVSLVRPILAEGARDGRWAMEAVRTADLPDFYLTPALAGMEFLAELKQTLPPLPRRLHAT